MHWNMLSKQIRELRKCIVVPVGSLSMGLCRHRAILFKVIFHSICCYLHVFLSRMINYLYYETRIFFHPLLLLLLVLNCEGYWDTSFLAFFRYLFMCAYMCMYIKVSLELEYKRHFRDTNQVQLVFAQKLADSIGLPCRIARGCKYCVADHRSSCLVKIDDDKKLPRLHTSMIFPLYLLPLCFFCCSLMYYFTKCFVAYVLCECR